MNWLRLHTEIRSDRKIRRLPAEQRWLWIVCLCIARESPRAGHLLLSEGVPVTEEDLADMAAVSPEHVRDGLRAFICMEMLHQEGQTWVITQKADDGRLPDEEWRAIRAFVFERDDYTCQYCGVRGVSLQCDHVIPVSRGGSNEPDNLTTACRPCNQSKYNKTPEEWRR